jgi:hypothetical protein
VVLPFAAAVWSGAIEIPQSDDWAYRRIAEGFASHGHLVYTRWSAMTLLGQIFWSWPFQRLLGNSGWVFGLSTSVLAVLGIIAAYVIGLRVLGRPLWACAAVISMLVFPGLAGSTSSFMTDVPALAAELICVAMGIAACRRVGPARWGLLSTSLAVGVFGFSIRQFAVAAPATVLLCSWLSDKKHGRAYVCLGAVTLASCVAIYKWWAVIPGAYVSLVSPPTIGSLAHTLRGYFTLAFLISPLVVIAGWRLLRTTVSWAAAFALATLGIGVYVDHQYQALLLGLNLMPQGSQGASVLVGARATVLPAPLWDAANLVALVSGALLSWIVARSIRSGLRGWRSWDVGSADGVIGAYAAILGVGLVVYGLCASQFFDRYLWPLGFPAAVLLLRSILRRRGSMTRSFPLSAFTAAASVVLVMTSVALLANNDWYDAATWHAGELAVAAGATPAEVDAGFEWVGAHSSGMVGSTHRLEIPLYESWYDNTWPHFRECAVVSGSKLPFPNLHLEAETSYQVYGVVGPSAPLFVYSIADPGC